MPAYDALDKSDQRTARRAAADGAPRSTVVRVLDLDQNLIAEIPQRLVSGQTDISRVRLAEARDLTTRVFAGIFVDPTRSMVWDPDSPSPLALWPTRMLQVVDGYLVDGLGLVTHKDFTGPLVGFSRKGAEAGVTCFGKEHLAQRELGATLKFSEGTRVVRVMRELMEAVGETLFDLPDIDDELPNRLVVPATAWVWPRVQRLARTAEVQAYYPGGGRFTVRRLPGNVSMRWEVGDQLVLSEPKVSFLLSERFTNDVRIRGKKLPGKNRHAKGEWRPKPSHPLSAKAFTRGGEPQRFTDRHRGPKIATDAAAERIAKRRGKNRLRMGTDAEFDVRPGVVGIDEGDLHSIATDDLRAVFRVREGSIGYGDGAGSAAMSINRLRRMSRAAYVR